MPSRSASFLLTLLLPAFALMALATPQQSSTTNAKIFVDPDLQLAFDGAVAHMESYIAASATDPNFLIAAGEQIIPGRSLFATQAQIYTSTTAGARWSPIPLPDEINGGWDNAVAAGADGSAYFLTSNFERGLTVYHTADSGKTWNSSVIAPSRSWDRPHIGIDLTLGHFKNRLYVAAEGDDGVELLSSDDGAKTFSTPVLACPKRPKWAAATNPSPFVLSDGTLVVPCSPYPEGPQRDTWTDGEAGIVTSRDDGRTFTPFHRVAIAHRLAIQPMYAARARGDVLVSGNFMGGPSYAVAPAGTRFADRIYAVWQDIDTAENSTLLISWSADHGATWTSPVPVDSSSAINPHENASIRRAPRQAVPMIAVNRDGMVGVAWLDGRNAPSNNGYDVYFSASLDGAATFLPAIRVSSSTSIPARGLNTVPAAEASKLKDSPDFSVQMVSPFSQRATGGDYGTIAADAAGRFHPMWPDARSADASGAWQLYTASIHVLTGPSDTTPQKSPSASVCAAEATQLEPIFAEIKWDNASNEIVVPVRLLNKSSETLTNPIQVRATLDLNQQKPLSSSRTHPQILRPRRLRPLRRRHRHLHPFPLLPPLPLLRHPLPHPPPPPPLPQLHRLLLQAPNFRRQLPCEIAATHRQENKKARWDSHPIGLTIETS